MDPEIDERQLKLGVIFLSKNGFVFEIFALFDCKSKKYAIPMSINVNASDDIIYNDLRNSLIEIIQDELNDTFLDWFFDLESAINHHFSSY
ncbi:hypothetical protein [Moraxella sp.]|uniref:hypothetical protein n=1 Tax=Moraxella sp. TaxID=479 RepID=UPI0026DCB657|nr:hypothetical protein [Moraxella sp.]MDO4895320.1 hypothetical protein [Moraxella sp.]